MHKFKLTLCVGLAFLLAPIWAASAQTTSEETLIEMLGRDQPYHLVSEELFEQLGWDLPDGGLQVKSLADEAPGSTIDPRKLETLDSDMLGYTAKWHELRFRKYNLDWDIPGLHLVPNDPLPDMPTLVIIHGGNWNWHYWFLDPLNNAGVGQYLAQKIPVLLITIPGRYRHGGWTEQNYVTRTPGYLLDRDVSAEEVKIRNSIYTFQLVADGVEELVDNVTSGPIVIVGHSTGGELQFILKDSSLGARMQGLSLGWATGGPARLTSMVDIRGPRTAADYLDIWDLRERPASGLAGAYLGPLNPVWNPEDSRTEMSERWFGLEQRRIPGFKHVLQDMEHQGAANLRDHVAAQIREALDGNRLGVTPDEVIADLFSTMRSTLTGYRRMIWMVGGLDDGHWTPADPLASREFRVAEEFRKENPDIPIRVMVYDLPLTHQGAIEEPRELAGGFLAALKWLTQP
ncbi:MAG: alpha/beta fold hydrolase [Alphaproteobacteria bacterium]|jgi:pimeloyl-ACP methyl ester carboxylesterase